MAFTVDESVQTCRRATGLAYIHYRENGEMCGNEINFTVTGNGFLQHMVRIMVGTLLEVGRGERMPDSIPELFGAKREDAGYLVPAQGLCLMEVNY